MEWKREGVMAGDNGDEEYLGMHLPSRDHRNILLELEFHYRGYQDSVAHLL